ncbi:MAG: FadR/GntR family transcriptional regulator [Pseudomonadota bacterium]
MAYRPTNKPAGEMVDQYSPSETAEIPKENGGRRLRQRVPIVETLVREIVNGTFEPGLRLPTENELCERFGASRTVIREVMQDLTAYGLISSRPRVGATVRDPEHWDRLNPAVLKMELKFGLNAELYEPLIESRAIIEPEVAAMAAARAKPVHVRQIVAAYERLAAMRDPSSQERVEADIAFHRAVLRACGKWVFQKFGPLFDAAITARMDFVLKAGLFDPPFALQKHNRIVDAIIERNPREARQATLSVLALSKPTFSGYFEGDDSPDNRDKGA